MTKQTKQSRSRSQRSRLRDSDYLSTVPEALPLEVIDAIKTIDILRIKQNSHLNISYGEPCFGEGALTRILTRHLKGLAFCGHASDLHPERAPEGLNVRKLDARTLTRSDLERHVDLWITNTPWQRTHLHPIIDNLTKVAPLWCILPAEFAHRRRNYDYLRKCTHILPVGPVQFRPTKSGNGFFCYAWYRFVDEWQQDYPSFMPRWPNKATNREGDND